MARFLRTEIRNQLHCRALGGGMIVRTVGAFDSGMVALRAQLIKSDFLGTTEDLSLQGLGVADARGQY